MGKINDMFRKAGGMPAAPPSPEVPPPPAVEQMVTTADIPVSTGEAPAPVGRGGELRRRVESFGISDVGKVRTSNEDHFVIASLQRSLEIRQTNLDDRALMARLSGPKAYLYAVADGVGSSASGRIASGMAMETIVEYLDETVGSYHGVAGAEREFSEPLRQALQRAHERLIETFRMQGRGGPATTLTIALLVWPQLYVVHVGDSRAYHARGKTFGPLTRDQTVGNYLVDEHGMSKEKAEQAGLYDVLASAIGAQDMTPFVSAIEIQPGDAILLCTDGLTKHLDDARIGAVLSQGRDAASSCRELVDLALADGARDNVTAIVVKALSA